MTIANRTAPYLRVAAAGLASGMRGTLPGVAIVIAAHQGSLPTGDDRLGWLLRSRLTLGLAVLGGAGELIGDKLPQTPSRLQPASLAGRMVSGGVCGAIVSRGRSGSPLAGAVIGATAALASSWLGYHGRVWLGARTGLPDPVVAIGEDVLAIACAATAVSPPAGD